MASSARIEQNRAIKAARHLKRMAKQENKKRQPPVAVLKAVTIDMHHAGPQIVATTGRNAMEAIIVRNSANTDEGRRIGALIWDAIASKVGYIKRNGWNAHLSFDTFKQLKAQGVML